MRSRPTITVKPPTDQRLNRTEREVTPNLQTDSIRADKGSKIRVGSRFSCKWTETPREDQNCEERVEKKTEEQKEENTEQKLFRIVSELLHTERAYVARLHLLDQVNVEGRWS